jgi:Kdo2-lipid IVA lauroyltransferase/acyltransferase
MDKVYLYTFYIFRFFIRYTPLFVLNPFLNFLAWIAYTIDKKHKKVAHVNLDLAFEDRLDEIQKELIVKKCYKNLVYNLADFVRNQGISKEELSFKVSFENEEILQEAIKENRKIVAVTAHYGNWELLGLSIAALLKPMTVVGRDLDSVVMNEILEENRSQLDMDVISKNGAMKGMIGALKKDRIVGILVDQNTKNEEGVLIDFFGKKARHTPSVALMAKKFNAIIIPVFIKTYDHKKFIVKFEESFEYEDTGDKKNDILKCVQKQADITQKIIEEKPDEWFWLHQRWKNQYEHLYK